MSAVIYTFAESNMVRREWRWLIGLHVSKEGTFALSAVQEFADPEDAGDAMLLAPATGLRDGAEIYERLIEILDQAGIEFDLVDLGEVARGIGRIAPYAALEFEAAATIYATGQGSAEANAEALIRTVKLAPFRSAIDTYCSTLSDKRSRGGGGISRPSERVRVKAFMEDYALRHHALPRGRHSWRLGNGFLSGEHDFG